MTDKAFTDKVKRIIKSCDIPRGDGNRANFEYGRQILEDSFKGADLMRALAILARWIRTKKR